MINFLKLLLLLLLLTSAKPVVVLDPGHGGEEDGAKGVLGLLEKEVVLDISKEIREHLKDKVEIILTREKDLDLSLEDRTKLANKHKADIFVSIHANASVNKNLSGIETYYLDNTNDKSSLKLAQRENAAGRGKNFGDLEFILSDLIQSAKLEESITLAHYLQNKLINKVKKFYPKTRNLGVRKAPFYVLVGAHMPCVLVEVSFIDHKVQGKLLAKKSYRKLIAKALSDGILHYLEKASEDNTEKNIKESVKSTKDAKAS